jgi:hypothetical protein
VDTVRLLETRRSIPDVERYWRRTMAKSGS